MRTAPGAGSTFTVCPPEAPGEHGVREGPPVAPPPAAAGATVLLAEDEEGVRRLVRLLLEQAGYRVEAARDGQEAVEVAERLGGPTTCCSPTW